MLPREPGDFDGMKDEPMPRTTCFGVAPLIGNAYLREDERKKKHRYEFEEHIREKEQQLREQEAFDCTGVLAGL